MNMKQTKRAQAALEFLTTYGWAFLVILIMIGALAYFGVLNPSNLVPDSCTAGDGFTCQEYVLQAGQTGGAPALSLIVTNTLQGVTIENVTFSEISSSSCTGVTAGNTDIIINGGTAITGSGLASATNAQKTVESGQTIRLDFGCTGTLSSGERVQGTANVIYKPLGNELNKTVEIDFSVKAD